jgi:GNAT superfamily N-acetyltransferase
MNIEQVSNKDAKELQLVAKKAILESVNVNSDLKEEIISDTMRHIDKGISNSESVFLKASEAGISGFILIQDYWNLSDLFVLPEEHSRGIGKSLFNAAKELCRPKQDKGYILVNSSVNAEGFYRNIGFESYKPKREVPSFVVPLIYNF